MGQDCHLGEEYPSFSIGQLASPVLVQIPNCAAKKTATVLKWFYNIGKLFKKFIHNFASLLSVYIFKDTINLIYNSS